MVQERECAGVYFDRLCKAGPTYKHSLIEAYMIEAYMIETQVLTIELIVGGGNSVVTPNVGRSVGYTTGMR